MIVQVLRHLRNIFMITTAIFGSSYFFQKNIGNDLIVFCSSESYVRLGFSLPSDFSGISNEKKRTVFNTFF